MALLPSPSASPPHTAPLSVVSTFFFFSLLRFFLRPFFYFPAFFFCHFCATFKKKKNVFKNGFWVGAVASLDSAVDVHASSSSGGRGSRPGKKTKNTFDRLFPRSSPFSPFFPPLASLASLTSLRHQQMRVQLGVTDRGAIRDPFFSSSPSLSFFPKTPHDTRQVLHHESKKGDTHTTPRQRKKRVCFVFDG